MGREGGQLREGQDLSIQVGREEELGKGPPTEKGSIQARRHKSEYMTVCVCVCVCTYVCVTLWDWEALWTH